MYKIVRQLYAKIFSTTGVLEKINNRILDLALSAKGFGNYHNFTETGELFFIKKYLSSKNIKLCFDIGANKGDYTSLILEETSSNVISFEPLPFVYNKMIERLSNYSDRCIFVNKGVGSKSETLKIHFNEDATEHASFSEEIKSIDYIRNTGSLNIDVISIDDYCKLNNITEIDFIKIDTEGFEKEVFDGALETLKNVKPKFIQIEYNLHQMFRNTSLNFFAEKLSNYNVYQLTYNSMRRVDAKHPYSNLYMYSNFVFIRKDFD